MSVSSAQREGLVGCITPSLPSCTAGFVQRLCRTFVHCDQTGMGWAGGMKAPAGNSESFLPLSKPLPPRQPDQDTGAPRRAGLAPNARSGSQAQGFQQAQRVYSERRRCTGSWVDAVASIGCGQGVAPGQQREHTCRGRTLPTFSRQSGKVSAYQRASGQNMSPNRALPEERCFQRHNTSCQGEAALNHQQNTLQALQPLSSNQ